MHYTPPPHTQFIGQQIVYAPTCASTNTLAAQHLRGEVLPAGTVVITDHQYQGRGQRGRRWYSEPHKNLTFSVVLYPTFLAPSQSFSLNIITALALRQALSPYLPKGLTAKWPNDIYYQSQKLGGVLIETTVDQRQLKTAVIGIGLNVNQTHFNTEDPTSLARICGHPFSLQQVFVQVLGALEHNYLQLQAQGLAPLQADYLSNMYWMCETHTFRDTKHTFQGKIEAVDAVGRLVISDSKGKRRRYAVQEITFVA